jgi:hypothetical protein
MGREVEIYIKAKKSGNDYIDYEAVVEPFMEDFIRVYGYTRNAIQVEQAIRRALRGDLLLPKHIEEAAINTVKHVLSCFNNNKVEASVCMRIDKEYNATICAEVYYWIQGIASLVATFRGPAGWHRVERAVTMLDGELVDYTDKLTKEMLNVVKYAYSIWKETSRI